MPASITLNDESLGSHSVTFVGIVLLWQLKRYEVPFLTNINESNWSTSKWRSINTKAPNWNRMFGISAFRMHEFV